MPGRRSRSGRERGRREDGHGRREPPPIKQEAGKVIDLLDGEEASGHAGRRDVKREVKAEPREEKRGKEKKAKVKKERDRDKEEERDRSRSRHREKDKKQNEGEGNGRRRRASRSGSHRRRKRYSRSRSSSSSSSSSTESISDLYQKFKPYTKIQLVNLVRKADLNGMSGTVIHPSTAVSPCPPGCILVRLETGREIAVKPPNLAPLKAFHRGPNQAPQSQEERLQQVLSQIKNNVDNVMERTMAIRDTDGFSIMDNPETVQGGIGHML